MTVYRLNPLCDPRWRKFLERHLRASVFHTPEWLDALRRTYGYEPIVLTTAAPGEDLQDGVAFCRIQSWLTGRRMVSLPFSDHCEPLVESTEELEYLLSDLQVDPEANKWKYVELRPVTQAQLPKNFGRGETFCFHRLDLSPGLDKLLGNFHKTSVQQMIRRAEREGLVYEEGRSESLLTRFYSLLVLTRRRQNLPPQPRAWFRSLIASMGETLKIRAVSKNGRPVASILTLSFKSTLVYKYGCSDKEFSKLGGPQLLLWKAIQDAKDDGLLELDMGRSDWDNPSLIEFKNRWGAQRCTLNYLRYPPVVRRTISSWKMNVAQKVFASIPKGFLPTTGSFLYRHIG